ncbi:MAG: TRAP transporter small permease [Desulfarculaceae bacterium]|jgi:TRAP-type C4-dicarboxylate transport system permease small subunit
MFVLDKAVQWLDRLLTFIASLALVGMVLLTCGNIVSRLIWLPIKGTFELLGFMGAIVTAFALGYTQRHRMHIAVDVLVDRFSARTRRALNLINALMCTLFFFLVAWRLTVYSNILVEQGELTETLQIIYYPFTYATALGFLVLALIFLMEILRSIWTKKEDGK